MSTTYAPAPAKDPTEVIGRRIAAFIIDFLLILALLIGASVLMFNGAFNIDSEEVASAEEATQICDDINNDDNDDRVCVPSVNTTVLVDIDEDEIGSGWWLVAALAAPLLLQAILQGLTGATIGKFITGIRVVNRDGGRPGIVRSIIRTLMYAVDGFPYAVPMVLGLIVAAVTKRHKRIGDMAAGTFVVRKDAMGSVVPDAGQFDVRLPPEQAYGASGDSHYGTPAPPLSGAAAATAAGAAAASRMPKPPAPSPTGKLADATPSPYVAPAPEPVAAQPIVAQPVVEPPTIQQPAVIEPPTIQQPAVIEPPTIQQPAVVEPPTIQQPAVVETPTIQQPAVATSIAQPPVTPMRVDPVIPAAAEPTAGAYVAPEAQVPATHMQSGVIDPRDDQPAVRQPVIQAVPVAEQPAVQQQPATQVPVAEQAPVAQAPAAQAPMPQAQPAGMPEGVVWDAARNMYVFQDAHRSLRWDPESQMWLDLN